MNCRAKAQWAWLPFWPGRRAPGRASPAKACPQPRQLAILGTRAPKSPFSPAGILALEPPLGNALPTHTPVAGRPWRGGMATVQRQIPRQGTVQAVRLGNPGGAPMARGGRGHGAQRRLPRAPKAGGPAGRALPPHRRQARQRSGQVRSRPRPRRPRRAGPGEPAGFRRAPAMPPPAWPAGRQATVYNVARAARRP